MTTIDAVDDREVHAAVNDVINRVIDFDDDTRQRIFRTAEAFLFGGSHGGRVGAENGGKVTHQAANSSANRATSFSESSELSPKDFMFQKQPQTDIEKVACLAYYLTHFRDTRYFKTVDISLLNTEAAQVKFSNAAYAVANAERAGLLVPVGKGAKQLSAPGERYVGALPDRIAAKEVLNNIRSRRNRKPTKNKD